MLQHFKASNIIYVVRYVTSGVYYSSSLKTPMQESPTKPSCSWSPLWASGIQILLQWKEIKGSFTNVSSFVFSRYTCLAYAELWHWEVLLFKVMTFLALIALYWFQKKLKRKECIHRIRLLKPNHCIVLSYVLQIPIFQQASQNMPRSTLPLILPFIQSAPQYK